MDELLKDMEKISDLQGAFTQMDMYIVLCLSFALCLMIGWAYRYTHRGVSYSQSYVHTLVIMGTVVALIMLIIGSNIARAFALVGALSIVRFRNAMKEPRDIAFVFMSMAIGMAVGTRFYILAIFATVMLLVFNIVLYKFNFFAKEVRERILRVQLPVDRDHEILFEPFAAFLDEYSLISIETVRAGVMQEVVFSVVLKKNMAPPKLLEAVRKVNDNLKVTLILGQQEVDI